MGEHPVDDLQRLLDGRLSPERAAQVEAHVAECPRCRRELDAMRQVKSALREHLPLVSVPEDVAARVRGIPVGAAPVRRGIPMAWRVGVAATLALAAVLLLAIRGRGPRSPEIVRTVVADFRSYRSGAMSLQRQTADATNLEAYFQEERVPFPTPVFTFDPMGFTVAGGSVMQNGRIRALFAYESGSERMICEMYAGTTSDLTGASEVREYDGKLFFVYRMNAVTLVFWQDGPVVCVLVMGGDPERAITYARVKAGAA